MLFRRSFVNSLLIAALASSPTAFSYGETEAGTPATKMAAAENPPDGISTDIGRPGLPGSTVFNGSSYTVQGSGSDIWNKADDFQFHYWPLDGDGVIIARVVKQSGAEPWAKAGVMIRESLASGSRNAMVATTPKNGTTFQLRQVTGGWSSHASSTGKAPIWVRLERTGLSFTAHRSADGTNWSKVGEAQTISMNRKVYVGLAVTSHHKWKMSTALFDHVRVGDASSLPLPPPGDSEAPSAPSGVRATATSANQITLSWNASTDNVGVTEYRIRRNYNSVGVSQTTRYYDSGLAPATLYRYTVVAVDAAGNTSAESTASTATTEAPPAPVPVPDPVVVSLSPATVTLLPSQNKQFAATVANSSNRAVTWSRSPNVGSIVNGRYTAPASIATQRTVTVRATSVADPSKSAAAVITLRPATSVSVSPATTTLLPSQTRQFAATIANASNQAVTWSRSPNVGSIVNGRYTAPASIAVQQTVTVRATSVADPSKSATAVITLRPATSVSVSPATATLQPLQTRQFAATIANASNQAVTWSRSPNVGSIVNGRYTAPASIAVQQTVTVRATSVADPSKSATAVITLQPAASVSVSPAAATLQPSQTRHFAATVANASNQAVTWSLSPNVGSIANGLYTAPSSIAARGTVTVRATSVADPSRSGSAAVTLEPSPSEEFTYLTIEAEAGKLSSRMKVRSDPQASQGNYVSSTSYGRGAVGLNFVVPTDGTYIVWCRVISAATWKDSFFVSMDGGPETVYATPPEALSPNWQWSLIDGFAKQTFELSAGSHRVAFRNREGETKLDQIIITNDLIFVPGATSPPSVPAPAVVSLGPATATLLPSQTKQFTATVANGSNQAVTWSLEPNLGSLSVSGLSAVYSAPGAINSNQTVRVIARSILDPTKSAQATVSLVRSVSVSVSPGNVTLQPSTSRLFTATVSGSANSTVTWSRSPSIGSISSGGQYTAPTSIASEQTVVVTATSAADPSKSGNATITLRPPVVVSVSPASITLYPNASRQFAAIVAGAVNPGVYWEVNPPIATITAGGRLTAPSHVVAPENVVVTATSVEDPAKSGSALVTLRPQPTEALSLTLEPATGAAGSRVTLPLSLNVLAGERPAGLQWTIEFSNVEFTNIAIAAGPGATAAGKQVSCILNGTSATCIISGMNQSQISAGVVATISATISTSGSNPSRVIQVTRTVAASPGSQPLSVGGYAGIVTVN